MLISPPIIVYCSKCEKDVFNPALAELKTPPLILNIPVTNFNTSLSPVGTAVLPKQAGLLTSDSWFPTGSLPNLVISGCLLLSVANSSVTVAGPCRHFTGLPF